MNSTEKIEDKTDIFFNGEINLDDYKPTEQVAVSVNSDGSIVIALGDESIYLDGLALAEELIDKLSWAANAAYALEERVPF